MCCIWLFYGIYQQRKSIDIFFSSWKIRSPREMGKFVNPNNWFPKKNSVLCDLSNIRKRTTIWPWYHLIHLKLFKIFSSNKPSKQYFRLWEQLISWSLSRIFFLFNSLIYWYRCRTVTRKIKPMPFCSSYTLNKQQKKIYLFLSLPLIGKKKNRLRPLTLIGRQSRRKTQNSKPRL